jgi:hypothetical protein
MEIVDGEVPVSVEHVYEEHGRTDDYDREF